MALSCSDTRRDSLQPPIHRRSSKTRRLAGFSSDATGTHNSFEVLWRPHVGFYGLVAINGLLRLTQLSLQLLQCSSDARGDVAYLLPDVLLGYILQIT